MQIRSYKRFDSANEKVEHVNCNKPEASEQEYSQQCLTINDFNQIGTTKGTYYTKHRKISYSKKNPKIDEG